MVWQGHLLRRNRVVRPVISVPRSRYFQGRFYVWPWPRASCLVCYVIIQPRNIADIWANIQSDLAERGRPTTIDSRSRPRSAPFAPFLNGLRSGRGNILSRAHTCFLCSAILPGFRTLSSFFHEIPAKLYAFRFVGFKLRAVSVPRGQHGGEEDFGSRSRCDVVLNRDFQCCVLHKEHFEIRSCELTRSKYTHRYLNV